MRAADTSTYRSRRKLLLGLIGSGIQASRTPAMHECEAAEHGVTCIYQLIDLDVLGLGIGELPELLTAAERMGFAGLNITHPCKQAILPLLTGLSGDAHSLGAVNTVVLHDGERIGHNTDWVGFSASFLRGLPDVPIDRIVQLGAGGAGAATAYAMLKMGAGHITIVDPDASRSSKLVERFASIFGEHRIESSADVEACLRGADGLIHATPTGMVGHPGIALPSHLLRPSLWVAEIVYFPLETELLRAARAAGCRALDGGWMAVQQAVEAFKLFSGLTPDPERMHRHFLASVPSQ
jgi:shikimate dehydrogenase